ncbi:MAG: DegT/DnrJ/EryC1/StrS family aminotransferase, partial [Schleiferiaceae bacterium]
MIPITKPFLPPKQELYELIDRIYANGIVTNNGPMIQNLEKQMSEFLKVQHLNFVSNGTVALQIAIKALGLKGKIITTPFSYIATTAAIVWENCIPVFADINADTFNIDPDSIEKLVDDQTVAILATHVFGNPCEIDRIQEIANRYKLKVIYDAAHCFGTTWKNTGVLSFGDVSTLSTHATKLFNTIEGGAIVTSNIELHESIRRMRSFGHDGPYNFTGLGINGKNSELHSAFGLLNLKYIEDIINRRRQISEVYDELLKNSGTRKQRLQYGTCYNYSYYPRLFNSEKSLLKVLGALEKNNVFPRRYFYPSLTDLDYTDGDAITAVDVASRILCL